MGKLHCAVLSEIRWDGRTIVLILVVITNMLDQDEFAQARHNRAAIRVS
jgi:hypothetical protein